MRKPQVLIVVLVITLLAATSASAAASRDVSFANPVQVSGTTVPAGTYRVKADDNGVVTFLKNNKTIATAHGKLVPSAKKDDSQWVELTKLSDGTEKVQKIHFARQNMDVVIEDGSSGS